MSRLNSQFKIEGTEKPEGEKVPGEETGPVPGKETGPVPGKETVPDVVEEGKEEEKVPDVVEEGEEEEEDREEEVGGEEEGREQVEGEEGEGEVGGPQGGGDDISMYGGDALFVVLSEFFVSDKKKGGRNIADILEDMADSLKKIAAKKK